MAKCIYCGQPAGFFRREHKECRNRHERATAMIPGFFKKALANPLPIERFRELLVGAAEASFIKPDELRSLIIDGVTNLITATLEERLLTAGEEDRITEVLEALGFPFDLGIAPYELLVKVDILRKLEDGKIPDRVSVAGPLPIELRQGESIVWVFNHVVSYLERAAAEGGQATAELTPDKAPYFGRAAANSKPASIRKLPQEVSGDLVVTNRNLYLLSSSDPPRRIPIARISNMRGYADGVSVVSGGEKKVSRTIILDDPWFAANLIADLIRCAKR